VCRARFRPRDRFEISRILARARRLLCAFYQGRRAQIYKTRRCSTREIAEGTTDSGPEKGNTVARSKKVLQRGIRTWRRTRYQIGPAADLADNPRSLVLWLGSQAQRQSAPRGCLLSVTLHLILRALHRARHFYAAAMTSARSAGNEGLPCDCC